MEDTSEKILKECFEIIEKTHEKYLNIKVKIVSDKQLHDILNLNRKNLENFQENLDYLREYVEEDDVENLPGYERKKILHALDEISKLNQNYGKENSFNLTDLESVLHILRTS